MYNTSEINRTSKPLHGKPIELLAEEPGLAILDNELKVYCIDAGEEEVIRLDIIIQAGTAYQPRKLVASSTGKLLKEGTKNLSSAAIAGIIDEKGAYLDISVTKDSAVITLYSLNKHLNDLLPVIGEMLSSATFPDNELNIHIERKRQEFLTNSEKVRFKAMTEFNCMVFGSNSAYGQNLQIDDFKQVEKKDIKSFYLNNYIPQNAYAIVSGKLNGDIIPIMNKYLGNEWSGKNHQTEKPEFAAFGQPEQRLIKKEGALQSAIRVGRPIISKTHPDYNAFVLLNTILGGYFGSRLMSNLREDKGYTYGVSSFIANYVKAGYFSISTEVNVKYTNAALDEIISEIQKLREIKVGDVELQLVKNYIYGTFLRNFDGPFALADRYRSVKDFGLSFDFYKRSLEEILKIDANQLIEAARKYLDPDDMIRLVVGNMD